MAADEPPTGSGNGFRFRIANLAGFWLGAPVTGWDRNVHRSDKGAVTFRGVEGIQASEARLAARLPVTPGPTSASEARLAGRFPLTLRLP